MMWAVFTGPVLVAHACVCRPSWPAMCVHVPRHAKARSEACLTRAPGRPSQWTLYPRVSSKCPSGCVARVHPDDLTRGHLSLCMWPRSTGHTHGTRLCFLWPFVGPISSSLVNILLIGVALEGLRGREWLPCLPAWVSVPLQRRAQGAHLLSCCKSCTGVYNTCPVRRFS